LKVVYIFCSQLEHHILHDIFKSFVC
jgi:hypothetical protein